jgi:hypothetical protein
MPLREQVAIPLTIGFLLQEQGDQIGVDVMITILCDFRQFSAKKVIFLINRCYDQNFAKKLAVV